VCERAVNEMVRACHTASIELVEITRQLWA
jgi:hypothetical protein